MHLCAQGCLTFSYPAAGAFLSTDYFAHVADKPACCELVNAHLNPSLKVNCTQQKVLKIKGKIMGCDFSLTLQMAQSYMSTAGGLGSIPTPSFPRVNHRLGDYTSLSLQLSVITDISFREANTEGQKYPQASLFHR